MFAFTLGCDCLRTSGVHVTHSQAIDQGSRRKTLGVLSGVDKAESNKNIQMYTYISVLVIVGASWGAEVEICCSVSTQ